MLQNRTTPVVLFFYKPKANSNLDVLYSNVKNSEPLELPYTMTKASWT